MEHGARQSRHEPGRYFAGIGFVAAAPHFQAATFFVPSVVPTTAVVAAASVNGAKRMVLAVPVVDPPRFVALPTTVMIPFASTAIDVTYLLVVVEHASGSLVLTSTLVAA